MIRRRSVTGSDGTIWQSVKQKEPAASGDRDAAAEPEQLLVTFQAGVREVEVVLPHSWLDQSTWPDWVIVGEIERVIANRDPGAGNRNGS